MSFGNKLSPKHRPFTKSIAWGSLREVFRDTERAGKVFLRKPSPLTVACSAAAAGELVEDGNGSSGGYCGCGFGDCRDAPAAGWRATTIPGDTYPKLINYLALCFAAT